jgi:RIO-like serine/threonine protein kinase
MDYFDGKPSYDGDRHRDADVLKKVFEAVKVMHSAGYVLGDVRPPNVMIGKEDQVMLIDFDWAGKEGDVRYPAYMSEGIWTDGIEWMEKINKTHDTDMHKKWFSPNSPCK